MLKLGCNDESPKLHGYWKFNVCFLIKFIMNIAKCEFFKYRARQITIKRSKDLKA